MRLRIGPYPALTAVVLALGTSADPLSSQSVSAQAFSADPFPTSALLSLAALHQKAGGGNEWIAMGATEGDLYAGAPLRKFAWRSPYSEAFEWEWQVSVHPYAEAWVVAPGELVGRGKVPHTSTDTFTINFRGFPPLGREALQMARPGPVGPISAKPVTGALPGQTTPASAAPGRAGQTSRTQRPQYGSNLLATPFVPEALVYYIRLIPTKAGKLAGPPSTVVVLRYHPGPDPVQEGVQHGFEMAEAEQAFNQGLQVYGLSLVHFRPAVFEKEDRWGCVELLVNPYHAKFVNGAPHPLYAYPTGEYCPPKDPSKQEGSTWDDVVEGLEAYLYLYDMVTGYWNQATSWFAAQTAGWLCEELGGDPETTCAVVQFAGDMALKAGLAAVGVPPSMPDLAALKDAAKGEIASAAADFTCTQIQNNGGTCDEEEWKLLDAAFGVALDQLQLQAQKRLSEPSCGDLKTAMLLGKLPLPCFSDYPGVQVKPALGSVYEPPVATVQVTRLKAQPEPPPFCQVTVSLWIKNHFAGGNIPGLASAPFPAKDLLGQPFHPQQQVIPALSPGQMTQIKVPLVRIQPYSIINNGWSPVGTMAEWKALYQGGTGGIQLSSTTVESLLAPGGFGKPQHRACGTGASAPIQLPGD